jgi:outer membrane protein, heavy metal efflux system
MRPCRPRRSLASFALVALAGLLCLAICVHGEDAESASPAPLQESGNVGETPGQQGKATLTLRAAVQWALERNPALATFRRNRGIAEAAVQIARQYPFNPIIQDFTWYAQGPQINRGASVTNPIFNEHTSRLDLELRHQGHYRRAMAQAALTRTQWEIAAQELLTSIQVIRAFNTLVYRQGKYRLLEEGAQLTDQVVEFTKQLVEQGTLSSADLLLANADVVETRNGLAAARSALVVAENDLRRALGMIDESFTVVGTLEKVYAPPPADLLVQAGLERRPDLHGLQFAVHEAEQRLNLEVANRWGNPSLGPAMEYSESSVTFVGIWMIWQLPVLNTRRGEIRQRRAELARASEALSQGELQMQLDVSTALARLNRAEGTVKDFASNVLPNLRQTREEFDKLYQAGQPGVTLPQIIDIRRRLLRTRDAYLDALFELGQSQTDLAAAVADLSLADCGAVPPASESEGAGAAGANQQRPAAGEELPPPTGAPDK